MDPVGQIFLDASSGDQFSERDFPFTLVSKFSNIHWKEFTKFLENYGCRLDRIKGDHLVYVKEGLVRPLVFPRWDPIPEFILKNNLRILGLSVKDFLKRLQE